MATILLNVKINENDIKQAEQQISKIFNGTNSQGSGSGVQSASTNVNNLQKSVANLFNTIKGSDAKYAPSLFEDLGKRVKTTLNQVKALNKEIGGNKPTDEQKKALTGLKKQYQQLGAEFATLRAESQKLQKEQKLSIPNVDNLRKKYANLLTTIQNTEKYYKKGTFNKIADDARKYLNELRSLDQTAPDYADKVNNLDKQLGKLGAQFAEVRQQSDNMHGSLLEIVKGFMKFQLAAMIVMKPLQMARNAWADLNETLTETEDRIVELNRVTNNMANSDALYSLAQKYGQTFENVSEITLNFARNGLEWNEALKATESALLAINVAELDATQASEGMIAIMQQYGYEAEELELIVDKLNITADNAAVTTEKLLTALQRTGSSAKNANLDLEETVGIITALSEATGRSGENLGTAVNSLIQFSTKESSLNTFANLGGDVAKTVEAYRQGGATVLDIWTELSKVIKQNKELSESVLGKDFSTDEFEALNAELRESLGDAFAETTEIYNTASTFRKNYFIALLNNLDQVKETQADIRNAEGYSQAENLQYLDTYTAKQNQLQAKWKEIANDEQGLLKFKKTMVDLAIDALDVMELFGGLRTVVIGVGTAAIAAFGPALVSSITKVATALKLAYTQASNFQKAMGWISVAAMAVSALVGIVNEAMGGATNDYSDPLTTGATNLENLSTEIDRISDNYEKIISQVEQYRSILSDETASTTDKQNAQNDLLTIQNQLIESNSIYASSLNLINGELQTQVNLLNEQKIAEQRAAIARFVEENTPTQQAAKEYLGTARQFGFNDYQNAWNQKDKAFGRFLASKGYGVGFSASGGDVEAAFGNLGSLFGAKNLVTYLTDEYTPEELVTNVLPSILSDIENSDLDSETKLEYKAIVQDLLNSFTNAGSEYSNAIKFVYGNKNAGNFAEFLSQEQRERIASGAMSDEDFTKLWNEFYGISTPSAGGGKAGADIETIVDNLKAIRDNTEKTKEIEEKQLALQEARNQRTVRVFNAETGRFEMQADERAIANAEEDLRSTALSNVIDMLENGKLPDGYELPDWLKNIVAPTSDDQFKSFLLSMNALTGIYNKTGSIAGVTSNNASTTNNNNNSWVLNGVPISSEVAKTHTIEEAFALFGQME